MEKDKSNTSSRKLCTKVILRKEYMKMRKGSFKANIMIIPEDSEKEENKA